MSREALGEFIHFSGRSWSGYMGYRLPPSLERFGEQLFLREHFFEEPG